MKWLKRSKALGPCAAAALMLGQSGCEDGDGNNGSFALIDLLPPNLAEWSLRDTTVTYDRESIFDYINGAGEVYRSYAFGEVLVARYSAAARSDVLVELFDMGNSDDAYGVFSYAREQEESGIGGGYEHKGDVLCFWQNRYYVCLAIDDPAEGPEIDLTELARELSQRLPAAATRPELVGMLPADGLIRLSERFFHLHQSLNYHYYLARENLLNLGFETDGVIARYRQGTSYLVVIGYRSERAAADALSSFREGYMPDAGQAETVMTENGKFVACRQAGRHVVVVLDADSESAAEALIQATVERITESIN